MKVSQLQEEISTEEIKNHLVQFKKTIQKQRMLDLFTLCGICDSELEFHYGKAGENILEHASCSKCKKESPKRAYRSH